MRKFLFMGKMKDVIDMGLDNYRYVLDNYGKDKIIQMNDEELKNELISIIENELNIPISKVIESGAYKFTEMKLKLYDMYGKYNGSNLSKIIKNKNQKIKTISFIYKGKDKNGNKVDKKIVFVPVSVADKYRMFLFVGE